MKQAFLMLAHKYEPKKYNLKDFYVSEKLDGMRAFWDGGVTRGMPANEVPFANVEKDARYVNPVLSTGLWSRYGKTIQAPDWWLDILPKIYLDGELYIPGAKDPLQDLMSIAKQLKPTDAWKSVCYMVFDSPAQHIVFGNREIDETNFKKKFVDIERKLGLEINFKIRTFEQTYNDLMKYYECNTFKIHPQHEVKTVEELEARFYNVLDKGGEGVMLRKKNSIWLPQRSHNLLKLKGINDAEATVIGYVWGRETDKGSKLLGKMGAMICKLDNGNVFELSGFTDAEREMTIEFYDKPGLRVDDHIENKMFPRGMKITFKYRELTRDGMPKEARYWRKHSEE